MTVRTAEPPKFHRYATRWEKLSPKLRSSFGTVGTYYKAVSAQGLGRGMFLDEGLHYAAERRWLEDGKPYYKLWPGYASMLAKTSLAIPVSAFHTPHPTFAIHLPEEMGFLQCDFQGQQWQIQSILVATIERDLAPTRTLAITVSDGDRDTLLSISLESGNTVEQCLSAACRVDAAPKSLMETALRLAVATSLLAVSVHRCVEHDVIAALRDRYDRAMETGEQERLADKSRRRGVNGWCIGRGRCLSLTSYQGDASRSSDAGRELSYQHVRGGHFHTVRYGPGRSMSKVVFFEPTVVRPDLPPPPYELARAS